MNQELYRKLFARMDELGAIRKNNMSKTIEEYDEMWIGIHKHYPFLKKYTYAEYCGHPPVLSDCLKAGYKNKSIYASAGGHIPTCYIHDISEMWDLDKPSLSDQEDVVGEELLSLISEPGKINIESSCE